MNLAPLWPLGVIAAPLAGAVGFALARGRGAGLLALTAVPAIAAAWAAPVGQIESFPWLLIGSRFGLDDIGAAFLGFSGAVWFFAMWFASGYIASHRVVFFGSMLLAMAGNFGLVLAQDMPSYYLFFALMSFASYGVVIHYRDQTARLAGKVYIVLVVTGEVLVFSGMVALAGLGNDTLFAYLDPAWLDHPLALPVAGAILVGFGIKAGALPLHVWLPLAHPAAPAPASAVLSGAMIKAGLLGWIRFLPLGRAALPGWGEALVVGGLGASLYAVLFGFFQSKPKTILAYSSISKMGLMTAVIGVALRRPDQAELALAAVAWFAFDHALTKGALFLGTSVHPGQCRAGWQKAVVAISLAVPALSLAGFAATGGAITKYALKKPLADYRGLIPAEWMPYLLTAASWGAVLLVARFLWVHFRQPAPHAPGAGAYAAWGVQSIVVGSLPAWYWFHGQAKPVASALTFDAMFAAAWPVAVAAVAAWALTRRPRPLPTWPAGDILIVYQWAMGGAFGAARALTGAARRANAGAALDRVRTLLIGSVRAESLFRIELGLGRFGVFGGVFLIVLAMLVLASRAL